MQRLTARREVAFPLSQARQRLHHPVLFTCLPGVVSVSYSAAGPTLTQTFVFPLLGERRHLCHCHLQDVSDAGSTIEARGRVDGELLSTAIAWHFTPEGDGLQLTCDAQYTVPAALVEEMVHALRRRSPLPIRSDADAILSRAVDNLLEETLEVYSGAYLDNLCAALEHAPPVR